MTNSNKSEDKKDGELKYIFIKRGMVKSIRRIGRYDVQTEKQRAVSCNSY